MAHGHSVTTRFHELCNKGCSIPNMWDKYYNSHPVTISGYRRASVAQLIKSTAFEIRASGVRIPVGTQNDYTLLMRPNQDETAVQCYLWVITRQSQ